MVGSAITEQAESRLIFAIHPPPFSIPAVVAATRAPPSDQVAEWALPASTARHQASSPSTAEAVTLSVDGNADELSVECRLPLCPLPLRACPDRSDAPCGLTARAITPGPWPKKGLQQAWRWPWPLLTMAGRFRCRVAATKAVALSMPHEFIGLDPYSPLKFKPLCACPFKVSRCRLLYPSIPGHRRSTNPQQQGAKLSTIGPKATVASLGRCGL